MACGRRSTYHDDASAAVMYNAVNEIGFDLWKANSHGHTHTYDIRVTREQARMYSHMFRDCAVIIPDVEQYITKMEQEHFAPKVRTRPVAACWPVKRLSSRTNARKP